ncbi:thioredoxin domain-containing protein 8 isoform X3 [Physeter macrocephalus]|uniref:Thioredoxin domain-containing protein 8 isoform X3 n=1 Tax=Physeter macrocephalus TaxID=9755 RepID=A0A9W2WVF3_PHYMC|nr:thioredoxin domain-containing protein 8 isoform X3 [Physeter catodon]
MRNFYSVTLKEMSVQYRNVMFANVNVDRARELAQIYHIKAIPTFQMFKQAQKVTVFSRIKRAICCYRSGSLSEPIFELCGTDAKKLEEKIRELM